ncbi:hypothetical protein LJC32_04175 [Oscillospiraceae bacterium OttesenSCG-928-F05]|nr:hypothetical protein [Oscillospiraceae bacterium OttesenSCG-928-F05]
MQKNEHKKICDANITEIDPSALVDLEEVSIDPGASASERMKQYLEQVKNPYCYKVGNTPVRVRFNSQKPTISRVLEDFFAQLK